MEKISAVYKIVNTVTNECYVGSSSNVFHRWADHKCPSTWGKYPNKPLYQDLQKYGVDKFRFQILAPVMPECLKQVEQEFIEMLSPTYNNYNAKGLDVKRQKETHRKCMEKWRNSEKGEECNRKCWRKYDQSEKGKEYRRKYRSQLCSYNGETLTLDTLRHRLRKAGVEHPVVEAKKYLLPSA